MQLEYLVVRETKLDSSFPCAQFALENYEIRAKRDRDGHGGELIEFVKRDVISKKIKQNTSESICSEITISKKKRLCMSIYRPPNFSNLDMFFKEITHSLSKLSLTKEIFIIMDGFNINVNTTVFEVDKLDVFCNLFDLTNLIKTETCCTKNHKSTIDLFLTKRPLSFQKIRATGLELGTIIDLF